MNPLDLHVTTTRRQLLSSGLALAGSAAGGEKRYAHRSDCNMYYCVQLFSTPRRYISARPAPLKFPPPPPQTATGGTVWTDEQWNTALSDVQYAGYRRTEFLSGTVIAKPMDQVLALLNQYGLVVNHLWHSGPLYPAQAAANTIAHTVEVLDRTRPLKSPDFRGRVRSSTSTVWAIVLAAACAG